MSNIHGLFSSRRESDDDNNDDDINNRYVGGIGARGGGSGLAVTPNPDDEPSSAAVFSMAESESSEDAAAAVGSRRVITMYRSGFVVDDGPYRRLDDPANGEFLAALAAGRTPREFLAARGTDAAGPVEVGLVDRRTEDYVETFSSFSGEGSELGTAARDPPAGGVIDPSSSGDAALPEPTGNDVASVRVRTLDGKRIMVRILKTAPVSELAERIRAAGAAGTEPYVLVAGFPPKPIEDLTQTIAEAGLAGANVQQRKA